ncbi:MAG: general secretion pathway protein GspB [Gammaproteobacteria bacterium]|nr:general secretion pathway protein GspB [Gammaproteobacteria bacterium]
MSFILDALRKSELERQRQSGPSIAELPIARDDRRLPWALLAIGLLLAINVGVLLYFFLRENTTPVAAVETTATPAPASVATVMTAPIPAPLTAPPPTELPAADTRIPEAATMPDATLPPPAPDPTLLPDARVTYVAGTVEEMPPPIADLPAQATAGLPELSVDLHIYSDDPAKRAVFINGRRYQRGGVLVEGPRVEEINREGAVLSYRGRRFLLPRQ